MSLSHEEQVLRELRYMNAQLNPGKAVVKAFGLLVIAAIVFVFVAAYVNSAAPQSPVVRGRPASRDVHSRPSLNPQPQLIKESFE